MTLAQIIVLVEIMKPVVTVATLGEKVGARDKVVRKAATIIAIITTACRTTIVAWHLEAKVVLASSVLPVLPPTMAAAKATQLTSSSAAVEVDVVGVVAVIISAAPKPLQVDHHRTIGKTLQKMIVANVLQMMTKMTKAKASSHTVTVPARNRNHLRRSKARLTTVKVETSHKAIKRLALARNPVVEATQVRTGDYRPKKEAIIKHAEMLATIGTIRG